MEGEGGGEPPGEREAAKVEDRPVDAEDILSHQELQDHHRRDHSSFGNLCFHTILDGA